MNSSKSTELETGRRSFLNKASYIAPAILTMTALPSFASVDSGHILDPDGQLDISLKRKIKEASKRIKASPEARKKAEEAVAKARKRVEQALAKAKKKAAKASPEAKKKAEKAVVEAREIFKNIGT